MAVVNRWISFPIDFGDVYDAGVPSPCGIAGSSGYGAAFFKTNIVITVVVMDNDDVFIGFNGNSNVVCQDPQLVHGSRNPWIIYFAHSNHAFNVTPGADWGDASYVELGEVWGAGTRGDSGFILPACGDPIFEQPLSGTWFQCREKISNWETNGDRTRVYYYLSFPINNTRGNINTLTITSWQFELGSGEFINPDYFPGKIAISDGSKSNAVSCNRPGGFFKRKNGNSWIERKNKTNNTGTVFIHNGSSWNNVAPKIGVGA